MERQAITVRGVVQGVGFRPFVYGLASRLRLSGFVKNRTGSVLIEVEGEPSSLAQFRNALQIHPPPLSRIEDVRWRRLPILHERGFRIEQSDNSSASHTFISPDVATCADCLAELADPADRRYRYPFLNCTNCGPRLTIIKAAPYDRERTTMAGFAMCRRCRAEYGDRENRRYHAQPTACPECGPRLAALQPGGEPIETDDPLTHFADAIRGGKIGAVKGLGGFHLVCNAGDERAVGILRRRKHRDEKPFAVMLHDVEMAEALCDVGLQERALLQSQRRPIVLLRRRDHGALDHRSLGMSLPEAHNPGARRTKTGQAERLRIVEAVAPGNPYLGVMLPYAPLHHLLIEAVGRIPLVMTSGNQSDEPIAYRNDDAVQRLGGIADVLLTHNRPIHVRCDDSVTRIVDGDELPVRRSRGYAPESIKLPFDCPCPMLAVGGQYKGVFALGRDRQAFLSHHLGELDNFESYRAFERDVLLYEQLFDIRPRLLVHDLHPDYVSTGYAADRAARQTINLLGIQHHHAHMASCMAEHGLCEPVIGVTWDGTGYGPDGAIWGGEFLVGDYAVVTRAAHLRYVRLPGADRAIAEPWRMAFSHLLDAGCDPTAVSGGSSSQHRAIEKMIKRGLNSPLTSSAGRLFDAVAAIAGVRARSSYEGQAAIGLEWLATDVGAVGSFPFEFFDGIVDTRPLMRAIADDMRRRTDARVIARKFHSTLVAIIATVCAQIRSRTQINAAVLSGGVFMNALLTGETCARLRSDGFRVYRHRQVPPNDGGLSLGQLAIAASRLRHPSGSQPLGKFTPLDACRT